MAFKTEWEKLLFCTTRVDSWIRQATINICMYALLTHCNWKMVFVKNEVQSICCLFEELSDVCYWNLANESKMWIKISQEPVSVKIKKSMLRWFGHVERKDDTGWVKHCVILRLEEIRPRGRPNKTCWDFVKDDIGSLGLSQKYAQFRNKWRKTIKRANPGSPAKLTIKTECLHVSMCILTLFAGWHRALCFFYDFSQQTLHVP